MKRDGEKNMVGLNGKKKKKKAKFIPVNSTDVGSTWYFPSMLLFRVSFINSTNCH